MVANKFLLVFIVSCIGYLHASIILPANNIKLKSNINVSNSTNKISNIKCNITQIGEFLTNCSYIGFVLNLENNESNKKGKSKLNEKVVKLINPYNIYVCVFRN